MLGPVRRWIRRLWDPGGPPVRVGNRQVSYLQVVPDLDAQAKECGVCEEGRGREKSGYACSDCARWKRRMSWKHRRIAKKCVCVLCHGKKKKLAHVCMECAQRQFGMDGMTWSSPSCRGASSPEGLASDEVATVTNIGGPTITLDRPAGDICSVGDIVFMLDHGDGRLGVTGAATRPENPDVDPRLCGISDCSGHRWTRPDKTLDPYCDRHSDHPDAGGEPRGGAHVWNNMGDLQICRHCKVTRVVSLQAEQDVAPCKETCEHTSWVLSGRAEKCGHCGLERELNLQAQDSILGYRIRQRIESVCGGKSDAVITRVIMTTIGPRTVEHVLHMNGGLGIRVDCGVPLEIQHPSDAVQKGNVSISKAKADAPKCATAGCSKPMMVSGDGLRRGFCPGCMPRCRAVDGEDKKPCGNGRFQTSNGGLEMYCVLHSYHPEAAEVRAQNGL